MTFIILLFIIAFFDVLAIISSRAYLDKKSRFWILIPLGSFAITGYFYVLLMAFDSTPIINILYIAISVIFTTLLCHILFKERVSLRQGIGILIVVCGIIFLEI